MRASNELSSFLLSASQHIQGRHVTDGTVQAHLVVVIDVLAGQRAKGEFIMTCNTNTKSQSGNMLLALLAGVGVGVVVGLAIAPKSGRKLRADIRSTMDDCLDSASQKAGELRKSGANLAQRGLQDVRKTAWTTARRKAMR